MNLNLQPKKKLRGNPNWKKGQSANPAGRPLGSRNAISTGVLTEFSALVNSDEAAASLRALMSEEPGRFWTIAASLLPREVAMTVQQRLPGNLDSESYAQLRRVVELIDRLAPDVDPQSVFETLEHALMAAYAPSAPEPLQITHQPGVPAPMVNAEAVMMPPLPYR